MGAGSGEWEGGAMGEMTGPGALMSMESVAMTGMGETSWIMIEWEDAAVEADDEEDEDEDAEEGSDPNNNLWRLPKKSGMCWWIGPFSYMGSPVKQQQKHGTQQKQQQSTSLIAENRRIEIEEKNKRKEKKREE
jgi:hypothetical protein